MKFWRRKKDIEDHGEVEAALERERRAQAELEAKRLEMDAKRPVVEALGRSLVKHLQDNHFSSLVAQALQVRGEHR